MATSGSFATNNASGVGANYPRSALYSWSLGSQNIANNQSSISWTFKINSGLNQYYFTAGFGKYLNVNGSSKGSTTASIGNLYNGDTLYSGSDTISHGSDGAKSFSADGGVQFYTTSNRWNSKGSGSWALPQIPRSAALLTAQDFNDTDNPTITYSNPAGSAIGTLRAAIYDTSGSIAFAGYRDISKTGSSYTFNLTTAERNALLAATPNSKTMKVRFYLQSVIGAVDSRPYIERTMTVVDGEPIFTNPYYYDTNAATVAITDNDQAIIQGQSTFRVGISLDSRAEAVKSATMIKYTSSVGGESGEVAWTNVAGANMDLGVLKVSTNQTLRVTAIDSRGFTKSVDKNVTIIPYSAPSIQASLKRENDFESLTTISVSGAMALLKVGGVTKNAVDSASGIKYRYKRRDTTTWGSWANITSSTDANGKITTSSFQLDLDRTQAWDFQFNITDKLSTTNLSAVLDVGIPIFRIGADGNLYNNELVVPTIGTNGRVRDSVGDLARLSDKNILRYNLMPSGSFNIPSGWATTGLVPNAIPFNLSIAQMIQVVIKLELAAALDSDTNVWIMVDGNTSLSMTAKLLTNTKTDLIQGSVFIAGVGAGSHIVQLLLSKGVAQTISEKAGTNGSNYIAVVT